MVWTVVRLELAHSPSFPEGSAARAYLLRLPLDAAGQIDYSEYSKAPALAIARRYWPNEPDREGLLVNRHGSWSLALTARERNGETLCEMEAVPISLGTLVWITESGGESMAFKVVRCD